jgi:hypothetical protein
MNLVPCSSCARHVRASDARCPFCTTAIHVEAGAASRPVSRSRAAIMLLGATLATGCGGSTAPAPEEPGAPVAIYGGPPPSEPPTEPAPEQNSNSNDTREDEGAVVAMYGGPPSH